jgi:hypothetical protein
MRQNRLQKILEKSGSGDFLSGQEYWEFREFYSPGYFVFSKDGLQNQTVKEYFEKIGLPFNDIARTKIDRVFLAYNSPFLISLDMLTHAKSLESMLPTHYPYRTKIVFQDKNSLVLERKDGAIIVAFLKSEEEMKRTIGFFDYAEADRDLVKDKSWVNITLITK